MLLSRKRSLSKLVVRPLLLWFCSLHIFLVDVHFFFALSLSRSASGGPKKYVMLEVVRQTGAVVRGKPEKAAPR
jgi:hypothetical protein